ncbi:hypothetical protein SMY00_002962 [Cronobacter sakazakii]|uniref:hypothetical protein n=1 Tax=Cronobacter sakazakii TaxID=28141 RepID=UPI001319CEAE|nr:hypothetical protein [Cronobacter sakazakii]ELY2788178.1 hypothetical protein [Cronobacter sakazakii]ELY3812996.1 hypothetical protein [Cronobacter sakazakii]MDK1261200.1 hypothetical protein [Cronobacter sakazakii]MDQ9192251.1 hypothetical protein [Cronobacter sakazakii]
MSPARLNVAWSATQPVKLTSDIRKIADNVFISGDKSFVGVPIVFLTKSVIYGVKSAFEDKKTMKRAGKRDFPWSPIIFGG